MNGKKTVLFLILVFVTFFGVSLCAQGQPTEEPLLSVACISDPHADYGLQRKEPYLRNSVIQTLNRIRQEERADVLLVGGDNTSDNADLSELGGWSYSTYKRVIEAYRNLAENATESGRSLWACGNHDYEAGEEAGYDAYAGYEAIMTDSCGAPLSVYRQRDDVALTDQRYPDFIMGLHYEIEGFDFIILNPPYAQKLTYSPGTLQWLDGRLERIGAGKTVFLVTHYPLKESRGLSTPSYGISGENYTALVSVLNRYPNVIYLYGHNHGGSESVYISDDTFERITSYTDRGKVVNNRNKAPKSFITAFMGSMSYYKYSLNPGYLTEEDPEIVQALMIYVYSDRIVFQMKNYGTHQDHATRQLKSWTVARDVAGSLTGVPSSTDKTDQTGDAQMELFDVILASIGGGIAVGGLITLGVVLYRMWKKDRATPYKD